MIVADAEATGGAGMWSNASSDHVGLVDGEEEQPARTMQRLQSLDPRRRGKEKALGKIE